MLIVSDAVQKGDEPMKVYKINKYWIAAESKESAFFEFLEQTDGIEYEFPIVEMPAGAVDELVIQIILLSDGQVAAEEVPCCIDGCDKCEDLDERAYESFQEIIARTTKFPAVIAKEE
jgi:hypothetical protein